MKTGIRTNTERKIIDAVFELIENNPKSKISVRDNVSLRFHSGRWYDVYKKMA